MLRLRGILGVLAGLMLVGSSVAHSFFGWPQVRAALAERATPAELVTGLAIAWQFGGLAMLVFGVLVLLLFADLLRGRPVSLRPAFVLAIAYVGFGVWALVTSDLNPFFLIFVAPGLMLLAASLGAGAAPVSAPVARPAESSPS